jgi:uroporphyrinogen-III synthase
VIHVLLTRPERDNDDLASRFAAFGCNVSIAPVLDIVFHPIPRTVLETASGLIATSRNGLRALAASDAHAIARTRSLPIFVVGAATAALAREMGFAQIRQGPGTAAELVPLILNAASVETKDLVHLTGDHVAFDLVNALAEYGMSARAIPVYQSVAAKTLPSSVVEALARRAINAVVLMSPRSARVWAALIHDLPLKADLSTVIHVCLSQAVAQAAKNVLQPEERTQFATASQPTAEEIVALVYRLAAGRKTE